MQLANLLISSWQQRFALVSPQYEPIYSSDKAKAVIRVQKEEKRRLREEQEREIREREAAKQKREDEIRKKEKEIREKLQEEARNAKRLRELNEEASNKKMKMHMLGDKHRQKFERRDSSFGRSSRASTLEKSSSSRKRDPKLDMRVVVAISRDEVRRAYNVYLSLTAEGEKAALLRPPAAAAPKEPTARTEEETRRAKARAVLDSMSFEEDNSNEEFNLFSRQLTLFHYLCIITLV